VEARTARTSTKILKEPPLGLSGTDPSLKNEEALFGINFGELRASELKAKLCPPGLRTKDHEDFCNTLVDATSLPGKTFEESNDAKEELAQAMGNFTQELYQARTNNETKKDYDFKKETITSSRSIKNVQDLRQLIKDIEKTSPKSMKAMKVLQRCILARYNWPTTLKNSWIDCGYVTKIAECSLRWYLNMLQHLSYTASEQGWSEAKRELDMRNKDISLIRRTAPNRLYCLADIYIYLREANHVDWLSDRLEKERMEAVSEELRTLKATKICGKCLTFLHGDTTCPWHKHPDKKARAAAQKVLLNMAKGVTPGGKDDEEDSG
jgi:hypothetical protein